MAAPLELFCWKGDYGLPSVDVDCLAVLVRETLAGWLYIAVVSSVCVVFFGIRGERVVVVRRLSGEMGGDLQRA